MSFTQFKKNLRRALGAELIDEITIEGNVLQTECELVANDVERTVQGMSGVFSAYYHPAKGGVVFHLET